MRSTTKVAATALAIASLGVATVAEAQNQTRTRVSISAERNGFEGDVSSRRDSCVEGRRVTLFQDRRGDDRRIGSDRSNDDGEWSIRTRREGRFYVRVSETRRCGSARSRTVRSDD